MFSKITAASVVLATASVSAQTVVNPQPMQTQNVAVVHELATGNVLRAGAPVPVALSEFLTTRGKRLKVGQRVQLEVAQDVLLNGRVVIPARSPVEGVLTEVRNKGMWGKSGGIHLHIKSVNINGTNIRLKGEMDSRGETGTAGVVGAIAILPVAGFFVTGTSAEMPLNMPGRAFLDQDIALAPLVAVPLPLTAPAQPAQSIAPGVSVASPGQKLK
ncbi:MAG: hypothetical protein M3Q19_13035 [Pseudomonadota bacterium]|nr:hypothetical protein [Pseudomonadota bacterium]